MRRILIPILLMGSLSHGAGELGQTFTLDGTLYSSTTGTDPLLESAVGLRVQILDPSKNCVLYDEQQTVNTQSSNGLFNIQVGSSIGSAKRTSGSDSGNTMAQIYQNISAITASGTSCTGALYTPAAGHRRYLRLIVKASDGVERTLSPDMVLDTTPQASVAETLRGYMPEHFLILTGDPLTQANVANVFSSTNYPKLQSLLSYDPSSIVRTTSSGGNVGIGTTSPQEKLDVAGKIRATHVCASDGSNCKDLTTSWGSGGTVSSVGVSGLPLSVANSTSTPTLSIAQATTSAAGYLSATDWNTFNGKLSNSLSAGAVWVGNASGPAVARTLKFTDIASSITGNWFNVSGACSAGTTLTYLSASDTVSCQAYSLTSAQVSSALGFTPLTGASVSGTSGYFPKFTSASTLGSSVVYESGGFVGIGTSSPAAQFSVFNSSGGYGFTMFPGGGDSLYIRKSDGATAANVFADVFNASGYLQAPQLIISGGGGYTRIHTASDGVMKLSNGAINGFSKLQLGGTTSSFPAIGVTAANLYIASADGSNGANVGIGTLSPTQKLEVFGSGGSAATSGTTQNGIVRISNNSNNVATDMGQLAGPNYTFWIQNADKTNLAANYPIAINPNGGNVGIGTTSPVSALEVAGTITATGFSGPITTTVVGAGSGSASAPSQSFSSDTDTGLYNGAPNTVSFSAGGAKVFDISSAGFVAATTGGGLVATANGTASAPTFSFAGDTDTGWFRPAADTMAASTGGTERVRINSSGNVGIGTLSPSSKLEVQGGNGDGISYINTNSGSGVKLSGNTTTADFDAQINLVGGGGGLGITSGQRLYYQVGGGGWGSNHVFRSASNLTYGSGQNFIEGGATWAPTTGTGDFKFLSLNPAINQTGTSTGSYTGIHLNVQETLVAGTANKLMDLQANGTSKFVVRSSGNVGIGTSSPGAKMEVSDGLGGSIQNTGEILRYRYSSDPASMYRFKLSGNLGITGAGNASGLLFTGGDTVYRTAVAAPGDDLAFYSGGTTDSNLVERMRILRTGNVGIGTTTPAYSLDVIGKFRAGYHAASKILFDPDNYMFGMYWASEASPRISMQAKGYGVDHTSLDMNLNGQLFQVAAAPNGGIYLMTGGAPRLTVDYYSGGNVGIGTTSPIASLEVQGAGSTHATTSLSIKNSSSTSSFIVRNGNALTGNNNTSNVKVLVDPSTFNGNYVYPATNGKLYSFGVGGSAVIGASAVVSGGATVNDSFTLDFNSAYFDNGQGSQEARAGYIHSSGVRASGSALTGSLVLGSYNSVGATSVTSVPTMYLSGGNVGVGTSTPTVKLEVSGDVKLGNSSATCNATTEGSQRYNSTSKKMEFCNGTAWTEFATSAASVPSGTICGSRIAYAAGGNVAGYDPTTSSGNSQNVPCQGISLTATVASSVVSPPSNCPSGYSGKMHVVNLDDGFGRPWMHIFCSKD